MKNNIKYFDSFPPEIHRVLAEFEDIYDSRLVKSLNVEPAQLNTMEGTDPFACYTCRPVSHNWH